MVRTSISFSLANALKYSCSVSRPPAPMRDFGDFSFTSFAASRAKSAHWDGVVRPAPSRDAIVVGSWTTTNPSGLYRPAIWPYTGSAWRRQSSKPFTLWRTGEYWGLTATRMPDDRICSTMASYFFMVPSSPSAQGNSPMFRSTWAMPAALKASTARFSVSSGVDAMKASWARNRFAWTCTRPRPGDRWFAPSLSRAALIAARY